MTRQQLTRKCSANSKHSCECCVTFKKDGVRVQRSSPGQQDPVTMATVLAGRSLLGSCGVCQPVELQQPCAATTLILFVLHQF
ncbi:uncharacterized protein V6R79_018165 [Siganus canaliculatus]